MTKRAGNLVKDTAVRAVVVLAVLSLYACFVVGIFFSENTQNLLILCAITLGLVNFVVTLVLAISLGAKFLSKTEWNLVDMNAMLGKKKGEGVPAGSVAPVPSDDPDDDSYQHLADHLTDQLFNPTQEDLDDALV